MSKCPSCGYEGIMNDLEDYRNIVKILDKRTLNLEQLKCISNICYGQRIEIKENEKDQEE